jgi:hypothetical protein
MLDHEIVKNDLAVVLQLLDARGVLQLLRWETARDALGDAVHVTRGRRAERIALVADALAVIATPAGPTALLVEIDMGTVPVARMRTKYEGYAAWWRRGGPERRFGLRSLRVLTIAKHEVRMERLREAASEASGSDGHGLLWFAASSALDVAAPEYLLENRFLTAAPGGGADAAHPLTRVSLASKTTREVHTTAHPRDEELAPRSSARPSRFLSGRAECVARALEQHDLVRKGEVNRSRLGALLAELDHEREEPRHHAAAREAREGSLSLPTSAPALRRCRDGPSGRSTSFQHGSPLVPTASLVGLPSRP